MFMSLFDKYKKKKERVLVDFKIISTSEYPNVKQVAISNLIPSTGNVEVLVTLKASLSKLDVFRFRTS